MKIKQYQKLIENDWWQWSVELEAEAEELDNVLFVEYTLHETFPNPVRRIKSRDDNFKLKAVGWGEFMIYAKVVFNDKSKLRLEHWLELFNEDGTRTDR